MSRSTSEIPAWKHNSEQKVGRHVGGLLDIIRTRFVCFFLNDLSSMEGEISSHSLTFIAT